MLPYFLVAPQIILTVVFFFWPASQALYQSVQREDPFGLKSGFVGLANFRDVFADPNYLHSLQVTIVFSLLTALLSMVVALALATAADNVVRGQTFYRTLLIWPYAVAPAVAGMLWLFMFNPAMGTFAYLLRRNGFMWDPLLNGNQAMMLVVVAAAWKQISYNFLFFLAGLQSIPRSLIEAAAIDGATPLRRFWTVVFPLLSPTTFYLLVINIVYAFFGTFGVVDATTQGGPATDTQILVYKVYHDGVKAADLGGSAAQSVILMLIVIGLTIIQFRFVERRVQY
jgi:sn-glycerol 3-phosphate transport system permease protein